MTGRPVEVVSCNCMEEILEASESCQCLILGRVNFTNTGDES